MQSDRELIELAAKAAGLTGLIMDWINGPYLVVPADPEVMRSEPVTYDWLNDDGDALRLAVKLNLEVFTKDEPSDDVSVTRAGIDEEIFSEPRANDPYAACRRAITRAAAALAKEPT